LGRDVAVVFGAELVDAGDAVAVALDVVEADVDRAVAGGGRGGGGQGDATAPAPTTAVVVGILHVEPVAYDDVVRDGRGPGDLENDSLFPVVDQAIVRDREVVGGKIAPQPTAGVVMDVGVLDRHVVRDELEPAGFVTATV